MEAIEPFGDDLVVPFFNQTIGYVQDINRQVPFVFFWKTCSFNFTPATVKYPLSKNLQQENILQTEKNTAAIQRNAVALTLASMNINPVCKTGKTFFEFILRFMVYCLADYALVCCVWMTIKRDQES